MTYEWFAVVMWLLLVGWLLLQPYDDWLGEGTPFRDETGLPHHPTRAMTLEEWVAWKAAVA